MAGSASSIQKLVLFLFLCISISSAFSSFNGGKSGVVCNARERQALLKFMHALNSSANVLPSWVGEDCCSWDGVTCNNKTAHVIKLSLFSALPYDFNMLFTGEIDPSLLESRHLTHLDLSSNNFGEKPIPKFFGLFKKLRYLNLSDSGFGGTIPRELGNLSSLRYLDLSYSEAGGTIPQELGNLSSLRYLDLSRNYYLTLDNLHWLSHLSSLQYLDMSYVNLSRASNWLQEINMLPSLSVLALEFCQISDFPTLPYVNFTSLISLNLFRNSISSKFPHWLVNLHDLIDLDLIGNYIKGQIPSALGRLCNLQNLYLRENKMNGDLNGFLQVLSRCGMRNGRMPSIRVLDLGNNNFSGTLPESLGQLSKLESLKLANNALKGVPKSLGQLSKLEYLEMENNALEGVLSEAHFANLTKLSMLDISSNSFVLNVGLDWIPPFQLNVILLGSCHLGPQFPMWLRHQKDYRILNLSNAQISDIIPHWFWNSLSGVYNIYLSHNKICGQIPNSLNFSSSPRIIEIDLSWNLLEGPFPQYISGVTLDLSNNLLSGPLINSNIGEVEGLTLSKNHFNGSIPSSICKSGVSILDLSDNGFTGQIPSCFNQLLNLDILDLSRNRLSGEIPFGFISSGLKWLQLSCNNFSGGLPSSFGINNNLVVIDLSQNRFSGPLPAWNSKNLSGLRILNLRSNMFYGNIPEQLSQLSSLKILDLSHNHFSGNIPTSFGNFSGMKTEVNESPSILYDYYGGESYDERMMMVMKGNEREYTKTLSLVAAIDLSSNDLSGEIPEELTSLYRLQSLNLCANQFEGKIPESIGKLGQLESLDLSRNHLFGVIPTSMEALSFLGILNLSYNNLSGQIPSGNHLQTLFANPSTYMGNRDLCGPPLTKACQEEVPRTPATLGGGDNKEGVEKLWFFIGMAPGFVIGFWCIFGPLLFSKSWRIAYYKFFDNLMNRIRGSL